MGKVARASKSRRHLKDLVGAGFMFDLSSTLPLCLTATHGRLSCK